MRRSKSPTSKLRRSASRGNSKSRISRSPSARSKTSLKSKGSGTPGARKTELLSIEKIKKESRAPWEKTVSKDFVEELWLDVQEAKNRLPSGPVKTFTALRIRPLRQNAGSKALQITFDEENSSVKVHNPLSLGTPIEYPLDYFQDEQGSANSRNNVVARGKKQVDGAGVRTSFQQQVFQRFARNLFMDICRGYCSKVITIGDRSAGKSHTMFGSGVSQAADAGIVPRFGASLFGFIKKDRLMNESVSWVVEVSGYSVRDDEIHDLLLPSQNYSTNKRESKELIDITERSAEGNDYMHHHESNSIHVFELKRKLVATYAELLNALEEIYVGRLLDVCLNRGNPTIVIDIRMCRRSELNASIIKGADGNAVSSVDAIDNIVHSRVSFVDMAAPVKKSNKNVSSIVKVAQAHLPLQGQNDIGEKILRRWTDNIDNDSAMEDRLSGSRQLFSSHDERPVTNSEREARYIERYLTDVLSGDSKLYLIACVHPSQSEFRATMKRVQMLSKYYSLNAKPLILNTKRIKLLKMLKNSLNKQQQRNSDKPYKPSRLKLWFKYEASIWDSHEKVPNKDITTTILNEDDGNGSMLDLTVKTDNDSMIIKRPLISLIERSKPKQLVVKDAAKDLSQVARDRYTRYLVFHCRDETLTSKIHIEISPGRLRFTGKYQKFYDDTGRQVVLEGLSKKGLTCELLNLDGLMTITKRDLQTAVLVNGKEIGSNIDKEVKVGDRIVLDHRYFFVLKDVDSSTTKTRSTKATDESEKKKIKSSPVKRSPSSSTTKRGRSPSPSKRSPPSKKSSSTAKVTHSAQNNGVNIYRKMLQESIGSRAIRDFETLQAFLQSNIHGDTEPFTSSDDEDDIDLLLEQHIEEDDNVSLVSSKNGIEKAPKDSKKSNSPVIKTRTSAKSNSKASPKSSISSNSKKVTKSKPFSIVDRHLYKLHDVLGLIKDANNLASAYGVDVIFQPHYFVPITSSPKLWLDGTLSNKEASCLDLFIIGLTLANNDATFLEVAPSIFCATTPIHFAMVVRRLSGFLRGSHFEKCKRPDYFFGQFSGTMGFNAACANHPVLKEMYEDHKKFVVSNASMAERCKNLEIESKNIQSSLSRSIAEIVVDNLITTLEAQEKQTSRTNHLKSKYESTMQKFFNVAKNATARVEEQQEEMKRIDLLQQEELKNMKSEMKRSELALQKTKDLLMKANAMRIDRFMSKKDLLEEYENLSRPQKTISKKTPRHRLGYGIDTKNGDFKAGQDPQKLSLISALQEKDVVILELEKQVAQLRATIANSNLLSNANRALSPFQMEIDAHNARKNGNEYTDQGVVLNSHTSTAHTNAEIEPNLKRTDTITEAVNVFVNPPSTDKKKQMTTIIGQTSFIRPRKLNDTVMTPLSPVSPTRGFFSSDHVNAVNDTGGKIESFKKMKKRMLTLEKTVADQRDRIEALEFENSELLNANDILKEQVASHLTKIQRISRTAVKAKELNEMLKYVKHMENIIEKSVSDENLLHMQEHKGSAFGISNSGAKAKNVQVDYMSMKQNHNVKKSLRKINPKSPTKKFNSSRKMGRRGENVDAKRSSIDLTVSYSQRSMSLKSINVKKKQAEDQLYYDGIDANGKDPTTLSTTTPEQSRLVDDEQERKELWTKLWAWKDARDDSMKNEVYNGQEQVNKLILSQNTRHVEADVD